MSKFFVTEKQINLKTQKIFLTSESINHVKNVLRMKKGSLLNICNKETGENYNCEIDIVEKNQIVCSIKSLSNKITESNIELTVFQGIPKMEKMELIIQKSVELGVKEIVPVIMENCVVKLNEKDCQKKIERWQKISEVAAKQSGRDYIPKIKDFINIDNICDNLELFDIVIVAYEKEENTKLKDILKKINIKENLKIAIIIGPEGGISEKEIKLLINNGVKSISLGKRILRTETVALVMCGIIFYELEN